MGPSPRPTPSPHSTACTAVAALAANAPVCNIHQGNGLEEPRAFQTSSLQPLSEEPGFDISHSPCDPDLPSSVSSPSSGANDAHPPGLFWGPTELASVEVPDTFIHWPRPVAEPFGSRPHIGFWRHNKDKGPWPYRGKMDVKLRSDCTAAVVRATRRSIRGTGKADRDLWVGAGEECFLKEVTLQDWVGINDKVKRERKVSTASRGNRLCKSPGAPKSAASPRSCKTRKKGGSRGGC